MINRRGRRYFGLDKQEISPKAISTVNLYKEQALINLTEGEKAYAALIKIFCGWDSGIFPRQQDIFYVTAGISFRVDFVFKRYRVGVEIDGKQHNSEKGLVADKWRTEILEHYRDLNIIRFTNDEVKTRPLYVVAKTIDALIKAKQGFKIYLKNFRESLCRLHPDLYTQISTVDRISMREINCELKRKHKPSLLSISNRVIRFYGPLGQEFQTSSIKETK